MKPPFMMLKSTPHNLLHCRAISSPLVPGKLADESQLGQLTSLFTDTQQTKRYHAPKPPKKRYLEENYSQNKFSNSVIDNVNLNVRPLDKNLERPSINLPDGKKKKTDENLIFPDVNPILPDVVPKSDCEDLDSQMSWRKKLLCWEKLETSQTTKDFERLQPQPSVKSKYKVVNSNRGRRETGGGGGGGRKTARLNHTHCPKDNDTANSPKPGRRGRARACKGQKYREFMWTNVIHQRRKSSRWELCQDTAENAMNDEDDMKVSHKTDSFPQNKSEAVPRTSTASVEINSLNNYYKKKKVTRKRLDQSPVKKSETKTRSKTDSPRKRQAKRDHDLDNSLGSDSLLTVTGSKKRKLRRQSIRRLEPGTSFKDTRVVEDSGLDTLASIALTKMKLRSGSES